MTAKDKIGRLGIPVLRVYVPVRDKRHNKRVASAEKRPLNPTIRERENFM